jgi:hypothetical protein
MGRPITALLSGTVHRQRSAQRFAMITAQRVSLLFYDFSSSMISVLRIRIHSRSSLNRPNRISCSLP